MKDAVSAFVDAMSGEIVETLSKAVSCPSVNPPGDTTAAAGVVTEWLLSRGLSVNVFEIGHHRSILSEIRGSVPGPTLVLSSHLDTVGVGQGSWDHPPFSGNVSGGRIYGRGVADAKGSVIAMCAAAIALNRLGLIGRGTLLLNPVADEETGALNGTQAILDRGVVKPDLCIVGEITGNRIARAEKGVMDVTLRTMGRTAHASTPWDGVNAIDSMIELLASIRAEAPSLLDVRHPLTPPPTLNIGTISGGIRSNVVPDECEAVLDVRILPGMEFQPFVDMVKAQIRTLTEKIPGFRAEVRIGRQAVPYETPEENELVKAAQGACLALGLDPKPIGFRQCSDGTFYARRGVPTILFGPGEPEVAHAPNESLEISQLIQAVKAYVLMISHILG